MSASWGHEAKVFVDEPCEACLPWRDRLAKWFGSLEDGFDAGLWRCSACGSLGRVIRESQG